MAPGLRLKTSDVLAHGRVSSVTTKSSVSRSPACWASVQAQNVGVSVRLLAIGTFGPVCLPSPPVSGASALSEVKAPAFV